MNEMSALLSAWIVGLLGGVHCLGMCGGIISALTLGQAHANARQKGFWALQLGYHLGRMASYTLAGALAGGLGLLLAQAAPLQTVQKTLSLVAGLFMILLGLYLGGWWMALARIERLGLGLWRRLEPLGRRLLPVRSPFQALVLGMLWGWLPCGLVYSNLFLALSSGGVASGAALMFAFGLGTLPNLLLMGTLAGSLAGLMRQPWVRHGAGGLVIVLGVSLLLQIRL